MHTRINNRKQTYTSMFMNPEMNSDAQGIATERIEQMFRSHLAESLNKAYSQTKGHF